jgi:hypothetical protein
LRTRKRAADHPKGWRNVRGGDEGIRPEREGSLRELAWYRRNDGILISFKAGLKSGLSPEDAALIHTFTGHMAAKSGFTRATVVLNNNEKVTVEFRR